jgi:hypothetical protein
MSMPPYGIAAAAPDDQGSLAQVDNSRDLPGFVAIGESRNRR